MHLFDQLLLCLTVAVYPAVSLATFSVAAAAPEPAQAVEPQPAAPAEEIVVPTAEPAVGDAPSDPIDLEDLMEEIAELRAQVLQMQQTLDTWLQTSLGELKAENEQLRRELRELYKTAGHTLPNVPAPDTALVRGVLSEADIIDRGNAAPASPADPEVAKAVGETGYFTVTEWGVSPEEAAAVDPPRASLKGLIGVVLPDTPEEELKTLGRRLRNQFDAYENINIEIFNDRNAAEAFKAGQSVAPAHRVLTVSRHKASNRDVILLLKGENAVEVTREEG